MSPKFSIIIPVYNVALYIRRALDSIVSQKYSNWEAICVDDGSTDGSGEILDEYAAKDKRFKVVHQKNQGVSVARNVALDVAQGEWVMFVDGDDLIRVETLEWLSRALKRNQTIDGLITNSFCKQECPPDNWPELPLVESLQITDCRNSVSYGAARCTAWTTVYKREKIGGLRFNPAYSMSEDTLFAVSFYWRTKLWVIAPASWYFYRQRQGSAVNSAVSCKKVMDFLSVENQMADLLISHKNEWTNQDMRDTLAGCCNMAWYTYRNIFFRLAFSDMRKCMAEWIRLNERYFELIGGGGAITPCQAA